MKTILYNPIFINPQAYYVFPRLTRYLQPDNESTAEPANYIGTIEVKVIAYGDTTLKRTYTNTDSIDLSEFKNTWIRISLFTKVGSCVLGEWKIGNMESDLPYIDPEVLASLKAVVIVGNKTNNDSDRAIVKNLVDPDNPFVISNAAYDKMSSYGGYEFAKFDNTLDWYNTEGNDSVEVVSRNGHSITLKRLTGPNFWYFQNSTFRGLISNVIPFKVNSNKNITVIWDVHGLSISEGKDKSVRIQELVLNPNEDNYTNLKTLNEEELAQIDISTNSLYYLLWFDLSTLAVDEEVTIEMLPLFEGAFVTDGIDDLITSTKTVQEMLGGSNEITVVSMIHQVKDSSNNVSFTNYIRGSANGYFRNIVNNYDKTGIYGYTSSDLMGLSVVNNILGDKNDYTSNGDNRDSIINGNFSVQGYSYNDGNNTGDFSSVAWYWTIIANKVLTTDQINQVIAYFNLDRTLKPDILCNTIKQGITNENHAEFGDKLIDYSGNGRDIQLNNIAWDGDSGIGKYNYPNWKVNVTQGNKYARIVYYDSINGTYSANFKGITDLYKSYGLSIEIRVNRANTVDFHSIKEDGIYTITPPDDTTSMDIRFGGENVYNASCNITITQIPSHAGGLCLDGINDFGKVTGMPIYKDYTVVADYERLKINIGVDSDSPILSKSELVNLGAFMFNTISSSGDKVSYSFGRRNIINADDTIRKIFYQSKYINDGQDINIESTFVDSDKLWLGTYRDSDYRFIEAAIYSLMSFPYSMSEFLIERQLKKHNLGTLYPDMVELRPIIKHDDRITAIKYYHIKGSSWIDLKPGDYIPVGSKISITTNLKSPYTVANVVSSSLTDIKVVPSAGGGNTYDILGYVTDKSPQKINITIEQDENYVQWNPVVESNVPYKSVKYYKLVDTSWKAINVGDYVLVGQRILTQITTVGIEDEVVAAVSEQLDIYGINKNSNGEYNILGITSSTTPQNINITIDEYIRYEDIVQPYPVLLRFNDENGNEVSWGGKFRIGSTITRIGSAADSNLLPNIYNIFGLLLNDNQVTSSKVIVEKTMVFKAKSAYIFDNNEPKVILSPSRLRIPNSSYKILGYIPDISGHGNHGVIHNSAYTGMSGANGYTEDFTKWTLYTGVKCTDSIISLDSSFNKQDQWILFKPKGSNINQFTINIKGIPDGGNLYLRLSTDSNIKLENGINEISSYTNVTNSTGFFIGANGLNLDWSNLVIEQVGEYEGAYCLDGVDDFVTIPTVTGGKQVLMKVNWQSIAGTAILYDQRTNGGFAIFNRDYDTNENKVPAYRARNIGGNTYIDGILNEYIYASQLQNITHNIVELYDPELNIGTLNPKIGSSYLNSNYAQMSLYDFMLFDNISTDDKIKQLNEYVGIEGNTEWRKTK